MQSFFYRTLLLLFCLSCLQTLHAQQSRFTISGYVKDSTNGETLIGATVKVKDTPHGAAANEYGFFNITLPAGTYVLVFSYLGFVQKEITVELNRNITINASMATRNVETNEVIVTGERTDRNVKSTEMSRLEISGEQLKQLPVIMGEPDVLKAITLLPGIKSGGEASTGFYVRGGGPDQNLVLMDEGVIYNPSHLLGFLSVFNADAVRNVEIIKGGMPANYGGRLSSILNVSLKEGNNQKYRFTGGVGTIASRFAAEGPIVKGKSSFIVSGRRTYIDALVKPFIADSLRGNGYYFFDLNLKSNVVLSDKDRLFFSGYIGRDIFSFTSPQNKEVSFNISWGNTMAAFRWNHVFSGKLFSNLVVVYNRYDLNNEFTFGLGDFKAKFVASSGIRDINLKYDLQHTVSSKHLLKYGGQYTFHTFIPGIANGNLGSTQINQEIDRQYANEYALYVLDEWKLNHRFTFNIGLRYVAFNQIGPYTRYQYDESNLKTGESESWKTLESISFYHGLEPRLAGTYLLNEESSIKASFTQTYQFLNLATTSGAAFPADLWIPSSQKVKPQQAFQYAAGYYRNFKQNEYEASVEAYYKPMYNQIEFKPGTQLFFNQNLESAVIAGQGLSYGLEFFFKKKLGRTSGWIGYTWSKTTRQFDELNNGNAFFYRYDRTHDMSFVLSHQISKKWNFNFVFVFGTGNAITLPTGRMPFRVGYDAQKNEPKFVFIDLYDKINSYRLPSYHRADVSFTYTHKKTEKWESSWNFSIYNLYNRANPFFVYFVPDIEKQEVKAYMVYLFPILPAVAWNFKF
ncbi:MAG: TonB-dependent receptor [Bacteroidota bacterium]